MTKSVKTTNDGCPRDNLIPILCPVGNIKHVWYSNFKQGLVFTIPWWTVSNGSHARANESADCEALATRCWTLLQLHLLSQDFTHITVFVRSHVCESITVESLLQTDRRHVCGLVFCFFCINLNFVLKFGYNWLCVCGLPHFWNLLGLRNYLICGQHKRSCHLSIDTHI